jgi:hypothetical protein
VSDKKKEEQERKQARDYKNRMIKNDDFRTKTLQSTRPKSI